MHRTLCLITVLLASCALAQPFKDDFASYPPDSDGSPTWDTDGLGWSVTGGKFVSDAKGRAAAICTKAARGRVQTIEATLNITATVGAEWKVAGVVLQDDERNYWHLALVESPDAQGAKHYIELQECYDSEWLASSAEKTRLTTIENRGFEWEKNHAYRLRLELTQDTLTGTFSELDGTVRGRIAIKLDNPLVVNAGTAGLDCGGFRAEFSDFAVNVTQTAPARPKPAITYPPFDAKGFTAIRDRATGFFHLAQQGGRWWLITPTGEGFYALGTDHANFNAHWCETLGYAPYHKNCAAKFNNDEQAWARSTRDRLKSWSFNALGCGWSGGMKEKGLPRDEFIAFGSTFSDLDDIAPKVHWTGFPNVFSPKWPQYCDKRARLVCPALKGDPWVIGYFLDNELEWFGKNGKPWGLFDEAMKKPASHTAKQAALKLLRGRYPTIAAFNAAWKLQLPSWDAAAQATELVSSTPQADKDRLEYVRLIAEKYFTVTNAAMKKYDPNHLNLGCRFAGFMPPGVIEECGKVCEVVTVNFYGQVDLQSGVSTDMPRVFADYATRCQRPMMITEWSFPAYDSGLPCEHGAGQRVATQAEKARCYEIYQTALMRMPWMVGSNYFMWVDEPAEGISSTFPEDSNYGLVDVNDNVWTALTQTATRVNARVYEIHSGKTPEVKVAILPDGKAVSVSNSGGATAACNVRVWVDGKLTARPVTLPPGRETKVPAAMAQTPGGHLIVAQADPENALAETDRADNFATRLVVVPGAKPAGQFTRPIPIVVSNPTAQPVAQATCAVSLDASGVVDAAGQSVPSQVEGSGKYRSLVFRVTDLPAYGCRTLFATRPPDTAPAGRPDPALSWHVDGDGLMDVSNGLITLQHNAKRGEVLSSIAAGDLSLGQLRAVMHEQLAQHLWVAADASGDVVNCLGPVRYAADITVAVAGAGETKTAADQQGAYAAQQTRPHRFRACIRITLAPNQPWFTARLLWVENTDTEPWRLASYFHYAISNIGGDQSNDIVAKSLPSGVVAWTNTKLGGALGCISLNPDDFKMTYWRDPVPNGGQHPDVWRDVDVTLLPGQRYDAPQPAAVFFATKSATEATAIAAAARAEGQVECRVAGN